ncbi:MAG: TRAP transporter small permease [Nitrospinaceae bacterium]
MRLIKQIESVLGTIETAGIWFFLTLMIVFSFGQAILRNFFHFGILWADIFLRQLVLWVGFLGAALAVREGKHISIDFLPHFLPQSWGRITQVIVNFSAGLISAFLAWAAFRFVGFEMEGGSVLFLGLPGWLFQTILPYSFCVMTLRFLLKALDAVTSPAKPG